VVAGGCFMIVAAVLMQRVLDPGEEKIRVQEQPAALRPVAAESLDNHDLPEPVSERTLK
jgi:hypothetical protein